MARKTVTYYRTPTRKPRPAIITGTSLNGGKILRVGHHGETYGDATTGILPRTSRQTGAQVNVFVFK